MSSRPYIRRRQTTTLLIVNCAFAEDCRCSKTGYRKRGFMENHLERDHPSALGLTISAPYCPACDEHFASKRLMIDHIMNTHVLARMTSFPARAVSAHARSVALSPVRGAATDQGGCADIVNEERISGDNTFAMATADFRTSPIPFLNVPTNFSYQQPAVTTAYTTVPPSDADGHRFPVKHPGQCQSASRQ
jgi:hypothetical protein